MNVFQALKQRERLLKYIKILEKGVMLFDGEPECQKVLEEIKAGFVQELKELDSRLESTQVAPSKIYRNKNLI